MQNVAAAGWGPSEITEAIEQLAMADRMAREENDRVDAPLVLSNVSALRLEIGVCPHAGRRLSLFAGE